MATTNHTPTIELSQYISTDKTSYLVNYNDDMLKIDGAIAADRDKINTAQNTADTAEGKADTNKLSIDAINAELNDPSTGLAPRVAGNTSAINTINSLIGNGEPTTTDKTLIGAINEINANVGVLESEVETIAAKVTPYTHVIKVTADGVKTLGALLLDGYGEIADYVASLDSTKFKHFEVVETNIQGIGRFMGGCVLNVASTLTSSFTGLFPSIANNVMTIHALNMGQSVCRVTKQELGGSFTDESNDVPASDSGIWFTLLIS